jgi:hypothetical protein
MPGSADSPTVIDPDWLLPDLAALPPGELYIERGEDGRRRIRFSTTIINQGLGPLIMLGRHDARSDTTLAVQHIETRSGAIEERYIGNFVFHEDHNHWHFEDFTLFELWRFGDDGSLSELVSTTGKMTFCVIDTGPMDDPPPNAAPEAVFRGCGDEVQGISVGWGDTYGATISGQELDIEEVRDGRYALRSHTNPDGRILETHRDNNASVIYVEIEGMEVRRLDRDYPAVGSP